MTGVMKGWNGMTGSTAHLCCKSVWDDRCNERCNEHLCWYGMTGVMKGWNGMTGSTAHLCYKYKSTWNDRCNERLDWDDR